MKTTFTKKANKKFYGSAVETETWEVKTEYLNGSYKATISIIYPIHRFVHAFFNADETKAYEKALNFASNFEVTKGIMKL